MYYTSAHLQKRELKSGVVWQGVLKYKDDDGSWKPKKTTFHVRTKREAKKLLNQWWEEMEDKAEREIKYTTVEDAIKEYLQIQYNLGILTTVSYQDDLLKLGYGIAPYIGKMSFYDLTVNDLQDYVNKLAMKYKPGSIKGIYGVVYKTITNAYKMGKLKTNLNKLVILPKVNHREINYLDKDGRKDFLSKMTPESKFYIPTMICFYSGMRAGEACGLRWRNVDFKNKAIHIREAAKQIKDSDGKNIVIIEDTKSHKDRVVPIMPQLEKILREWKKHQHELGKDKSNDFVVDDRNPRLLCTSFLKWAQRNKVYGTMDKAITMHGLRHTFATMAVQSKMDIKSLQTILGHSSAVFTLDIYAADDMHAKQVNMEILSRMMNEELN